MVRSRFQMKGSWARNGPAYKALIYPNFSLSPILCPILLRSPLSTYIESPTSFKK